MDRVTQEGRQSVITNWFPASGTIRNARIHERWSLYDQLRSGSAFNLTTVLEDLLPLATLLDKAGHVGLYPVEFSPDHLVYNGRLFGLVGFSRHGYCPVDFAFPLSQGRSECTQMLLGNDCPKRTADVDQFRAIQARALLRLSAWMACGIDPLSTGATDSSKKLDTYLERAGFLLNHKVPSRDLAPWLHDLLLQEKEASASEIVRQTRAFLFHEIEDTQEESPKSSASTHQASVATPKTNPESIRLGLCLDYKNSVLGVASYDDADVNKIQTALLGSSGWLLVNRNSAARIVKGLASALSSQASLPAMYISDQPAWAQAEPLPYAYVCDPNGDSENPKIAGLHWSELPYVLDRDLRAFKKEVLRGIGGQGLARKTFSAGWAMRLIADKEGGKKGEEAQANSVEVSVLSLLSELLHDRVDVSMHVLSRDVPSDAKQWEYLRRLREFGWLLTHIPMLSLLGKEVLTAIEKGKNVDYLKRFVSEVLPAAGGPKAIPLLANNGASLLNLARMAHLGVFARLNHGGPATQQENHCDLMGDTPRARLRILSNFQSEVASYLAGVNDRSKEWALARAIGQWKNKVIVSKTTLDEWRALRHKNVPLDTVKLFGPLLAKLCRYEKETGVKPKNIQDWAQRSSVRPHDLLSELTSHDIGKWSLIKENATIALEWYGKTKTFDVVYAIEALPTIKQFVHAIDVENVSDIAAGTVNEKHVALANVIVRITEHGFSKVLKGVKTVNVDEIDSLTLESEPQRSCLRAFFGTHDLQALLFALRDGGAYTWVLYGACKPLQASETAFEVSSSLNVDLDYPEDPSAERIRIILQDNPRLVARIRSLPLMDREYLRRKLDLLPSESWKMELAGIARLNHPLGALRISVNSGMSIVDADRLAAAPGLETHQARLFALGPLLKGLKKETLLELLSLGLSESASTALATIEQWRPGGIAVCHRFGGCLVPLVLGPHGKQLIRVLSDTLEPREGVGEWLCRGGKGAVESVEAYGKAMLDLVASTTPPGSHTRLLCAALDVSTGDATIASRVYNIGIEHGVPVAIWSHLARQLRRRRDTTTILARLFIRGAAA
jgi:hypothetical protein